MGFELCPRLLVRERPQGQPFAGSGCPPGRLWPSEIGFHLGAFLAIRRLFGSVGCDDSRAKESPHFSFAIEVLERDREEVRKRLCSHFGLRDLLRGRISKVFKSIPMIHCNKSWRTYCTESSANTWSSSSFAAFFSLARAFFSAFFSLRRGGMTGARLPLAVSLSAGDSAAVGSAAFFFFFLDC